MPGALESAAPLCRGAVDSGDVTSQFGPAVIGGGSQRREIPSLIDRLAPNPDPDVDQPSQSQCPNKETKKGKKNNQTEKESNTPGTARNQPPSHSSPKAGYRQHIPREPIKIAPRRFGKRPWRARCPRTVRSVAFSSESMAGTVGIVGPPGFQGSARYQGRFQGSSRGPSEMAGAARAAGCIARSDVDEMSLPGEDSASGRTKRLSEAGCLMETHGTGLPPHVAACGDRCRRHGAVTARER